MKKFSLVLTVIAAFTLAFTAPAQTNTPTPPADSGSFMGTVTSYFTSFNTNLDGTFGLSKASLWTGVDSIQGGKVPLANEIGMSYKLIGPVSGEAVVRDGGITGTIVSLQGGLGASVIVHDVRLTGYADGLYLRQATEKLGAEIGLRVAKALTDHTYAWVGMGFQIPNDARVFSAGVGFTF